jgi:Peptidase MA superfamily
MTTFFTPKCTKVFWLLLVGVMVYRLLDTGQVWAQAGIEMESTATYIFGQQITFVAQLKSPVQVQQATIVILDESRGVSHVRPVAFTDGRSEFVFDTRQNLLRPFSSLSWYYQLTLADGSSVQSASQSIRYEDDRYAWQKLEAGTLRVLWAQGDAAFGQNALNGALSGLQSISDLLPVDLAQPVEIYIYPNQADISFLSGEAFEEAGRAYPDLGIALVAAELDSNQSVNLERRIPHELMHVMLYRQVGAGYKNLPVWLSEGFAALAEINPTPDYDRVLLDASNRNALIPLWDLCASFPADSAAAFLAYAEARSFTAYLRDTYGAPALLNLAKVYAGGVDCENGSQNVFGASLAQMDATWREKALGQNVLGVAFRNMLPYLVLLLLLILVPLIVGLNASRQKAGQNGSGTSTKR